jgi:hypothetical protein
MLGIGNARAVAGVTERVPRTPTPIAQFALEHNLDEWRRFHDWIVLTKGKLDLIEEIISLGHKYSGLLSRYKVAKEVEQEPLLRDLRTVLQMMQTLYGQSRDRRGCDLHWKPL